MGKDQSQIAQRDTTLTEMHSANVFADPSQMELLQATLLTPKSWSPSFSISAQHLSQQDLYLMGVALLMNHGHELDTAGTRLPGLLLSCGMD